MSHCDLVRDAKEVIMSRINDNEGGSIYTLISSLLDEELNHQSNPELRKIIGEDR